MSVGLLDIDNASLDELKEEYAKCEADWGKWSSDSFGFYIEALRRQISKLQNQTSCD